MENNSFIRKYYNNGTTIDIYYRGCKNKEINIEDTYNLIDKVFNGYSSSNILNIIRDIRTIFRDYTEEYLEIYVITNTCETCVKYEYGNLINYNEEKYINKNDKINFNYESGKNLSYSIDGDLKLFRENKINYYDKYLEYLNKLEKIIPIEIYHNEELLCKVYKLFYDANPDFCDKDINIKIQTMISILAQFNICLNYPMSVNSHGKMPINLSLVSLIYDLRALGCVDVDKLKTFKLSYPHEKEIKEIGNIVRHSDINLITLSKIVHAGNYDLSDKSNITYINDSTNCSNIEIDESIQLVKRINKKLK